MAKRVYTNGLLIEDWRDGPDYAVFDGAGVKLRDYTPAEKVEADALAAADTARAQRESDRALVNAIITDLQAEKARCDTVLAKTPAQITGTDTKDVARAAKRIADAAIDLARFVKSS